MPKYDDAPALPATPEAADAPALPATGTVAELAAAAGHPAWLGAAAGAQLGFPAGAVTAADYAAAVERVHGLRFS